jgi:hypothetical protein
MNRQQQLLSALEMEADLADYWHDVDTAWGTRAGEYYTQDAVFEAGRLRLEGREAIQRFYSWREGRGARTAVHAVTNFRAVFDDQGGAVANWYMLLYAADGEPVLPTHSPVRISRMTDQYLQDAASGRWLCKYRRFETLFEGGALLNVPDLTRPGDKKAP